MLLNVSGTGLLRRRCYPQGFCFAGFAPELFALDFHLNLFALHWSTRYILHIDLHVDGAVDDVRS